MTEAIDIDALATERDNAIYLHSAGVVFVSYLEDSFAISSDQSATLPPTTEQLEAGVWKVNVKCGRKKTAPIAQQFVDLCGGQDYVYNNESWIDRKPAELNFYFAVKIAFGSKSTYREIIVYLGQGSVGTSENWWIGSTALANRGSNPVILPIIGYSTDAMTPVLSQVFTVKYLDWDEILFDRWLSPSV